MPERRVILLAAATVILDPAEELDQVVREISDRTVRYLTDYHRLGPALTCADTDRGP